MLKTTLLTILVVLGLSSTVNANDLYQRDSDFATRYHACFSTQIGFDILQNSMDSIFTEYINRYNSGQKSDIRKINTNANSKLNGKAYDVKRGDAIRLTNVENGLEFSVDYTGISAEDKIEGTFKIYLDIVYPTAKNLQKVPVVRLRLDRTSELAGLIFTFEEGTHFDQPSATRMLTGFIRTLNEYSMKSAASTYVAINDAAMNLNFMLNCNKEELSTFKESMIPSDLIEFGLSNNIMNMVYPYAYDFRLNTLVNRMMMFNPNMHSLYEKYNLRQARGLLRLTTDPQILDQIEKQEEFTTPKMTTVNQDVSNKQASESEQGEIKRITSSLFVEFQDYTNGTTYDLVVAPMDITWDIKASIEDREDGTQKFNAEFVKTKFKFKKCELLYNRIVPLKKSELPQGGADEDEDDFDDESEDEASAFNAMMGFTDVDERKKLISNYQNLGCGAKGMLPQKMKENKANVQMYSKKMIDFVLDGFKHLSDIPEGESYQFKCSGLNLSRPRTKLEKSRIVVSMKLKGDGNAVPEHLKDFCDKEDQELLRVDPRTFTFEQMQVVRDWLVYETHNQNFMYLFEVGKRGYVQNAKTFMDIMSPVAQAVSSHEFLQDYCREHHPKVNSQRCALVYSQAKGWEEYNQILNATHLTLLDPRNEHNPDDIDLNQDEFLEVDGEIYTDFEHFYQHNWNIKSEKMNKVLQLRQSKKFKHHDVLYLQIHQWWYKIMISFVNSVDEYCSSHTVGQCQLRKDSIKALEDEESARIDTLNAIFQKGVDIHFHYDPCQDAQSDCSQFFNETTMEYITDPAEILAIQNKNDELRNNYTKTASKKEQNRNFHKSMSTIPGTHNLEKYIPKFKKENVTRLKGVVPDEVIDKAIAEDEAAEARKAANAAAIEAPASPDAAATPDAAAAAPEAAAAPDAAAGAKDEL